jgi:pyrophosphate--fructose-6-phosphate 1-phosphotransferase
LKHKIGILTAGGLAPCLSASIARLIEKYTELIPDIEIIGYLHGYRGLLMNNSIEITEKAKDNISLLYDFGGTAFGSSRVKLSNVQDCVKKGYVSEGQNPLHVAAEQLSRDGITILHTIGGDDTSLTAANLTGYLEENGYDLTVVGLPKTIDNDIIPIQCTMGAQTAAEEAARFFENIVNENTTSTRHLLIHEVMGRYCGWMTATSAYEYRKKLSGRKFLPDILVSKDRWDIDAIYIPEISYDFDDEIERLQKRMDEKDCVNVFFSEGAGVERIVAELEAEGKTVKRDPFGHVRLDDINPGQWFAKKLTKMLKADKVLVQKSGYFCRSAAPNQKDLDLVKKTADQAVQFGLNGQSGVVGMDTDYDNQMRCIEFGRVKGGRTFDIRTPWFKEILDAIGQRDYDLYKIRK